MAAAGSQFRYAKLFLCPALEEEKPGRTRGWVGEEHGSRLLQVTGHRALEQEPSVTGDSLLPHPHEMAIWFPLEQALGKAEIFHPLHKLAKAFRNLSCSVFNCFYSCDFSHNSEGDKKPGKAFLVVVWDPPH